MKYPKTAVSRICMKITASLLFLMLIALGYRWQIGCIWQRLFHIPCPGCGMTRACLALLRGQIATAFSYHFMFPTLPLLYAYFLFDGRPFRNRFLNVGVLCLLVVGFLVHWIQMLCL